MAARNGERALIPLDEGRHLKEGPRRDERPGGAGTVTVVAEARGDAADVLARAREVMGEIVKTGEPWPDLEYWRSRLPRWFLEASAPERSREEIEQWLAWWRSLPPQEQAHAAAEQKWTLADWLFSVQPSERQWFWWSATVESPDKVRVLVEVPGDPVALGALEWLLRAAGATDITQPE